MSLLASILRALRSFLLRIRDPGPVVGARLATAAEHALRAGVRPTLAEWEGLAAAERRAWVAAGDRVAAARAATYALASTAPSVAVGIAATADGGLAARAFEEAERAARERRRVDLLRAAADDLHGRYRGAA